MFLYAAPAILISGYASPVGNRPLALQWLSLMDPARYMLLISRGMVLENLPLSVALQQSWPMAFIGFGLLGIAGLFVRRAL
ncbi:MAG TPA: hypothetical protein VMH92_13365 [Acidocella sp.]|nr:hypothetical protein [Acidocella sp.]